MKRILFLILSIISVFQIYSQDVKGLSGLSYKDLGALMSKDDNFGTARFEAMSGAFGALGGDVSSVYINPAGMSINLGSLASLTLGVSSLSSKYNFYGKPFSFSDDYFNLGQIGGVMVFNSSKPSGWNNFAVTFNYRKKNLLKGNKRVLVDNIVINNEEFSNIDYSLKMGGSSNVINIGFSSSYNDKLYLGGVLNFHSFEYMQETFLGETRKGKIGTYEMNKFFETVGVSLGFGAIYKINHNFRLGVAYETPTWYSEIEEAGDLYLSNKVGQGQTRDFSTIYSFKTPSKLTLSSAIVFGNKGLISIDYSYRNYKNMKYTQYPNELMEDFEFVNNKIVSNYQNTHSVNVGTEWRFNRVSVRGGYHFEQNPNTTIKGNFNSFSVGAGYNFGRMTLDLSYKNSNYDNAYGLYKLNDLSISDNTHRIVGTLTFKF